MPILTVSQLNFYVASLLREDSNLKGLLLRGEISNFKKQFKSGHCYFTLRDDADHEAAISAVMFRFNADRLKFTPENGMHVIVQGSINLYEATGSYQINVTDMQPDGIGAQALALRQRRERLAKKGYFAPERKRPLPTMPKKIGIVTSRSGAALQDMLHILERRYPLGTVCIYPALVQGEQAPASIADALRIAGADHCDVILMGRGGGSNEDLSAFQTEVVADAIFASPVPVVSCVGHETDHCIADEVADLRAPTPSAAAELAVPDLPALKSLLQIQTNHLHAAMQTILTQHQQTLDALRHRLEHQSVDKRIALQSEMLTSLTLRLHHAAQGILQEKTKQWELAANRLEAVSPVAILQRGYALVYHDDSLVRHADALQCGDSLRIQLAEGSLEATVTAIHENPEPEMGFVKI